MDVKDRVRFVLSAKVIKAGKKTMITSGRKDGNETVLTEADVGFFVQFGDGASYLFAEDLGFRAGDEIRITFEKVTR